MRPSRRERIATSAYDREPPRIAHYSSEYARVGFVLDRSGELAKLRFDGSEEIFVLRWQPAAGGDRLLVRDDGEVVLRISGLGGMTLFTPENPPRHACGARRAAPPLMPAPPSIGSVRDIAGRIMAQLRAETGKEIVFEANWGAALGRRGCARNFVRRYSKCRNCAVRHFAHGAGTDRAFELFEAGAVRAGALSVDHVARRHADHRLQRRAGAGGAAVVVRDPAPAGADLALSGGCQPGGAISKPFKRERGRDRAADECVASKGHALCQTRFGTTICGRSPAARLAPSVCIARAVMFGDRKFECIACVPVPDLGGVDAMPVLKFTCFSR